MKDNKDIKLTATEEELTDGTTGRCTACGAEAYDVEPDAREYECVQCNEPAVYGLEELLVMGKLEIVEE